MYMYIFSIYRFTTRITTRKGKYNIQHRWFPLLNMTNHGPLAKATVPELDPEKIYRVGSEEKVGLTCGFLWFYCRCSPEKNTQFIDTSKVIFLLEVTIPTFRYRKYHLLEVFH